MASGPGDGVGPTPAEIARSLVRVRFRTLVEEGERALARGDAFHAVQAFSDAKAFATKEGMNAAAAEEGLTLAMDELNRFQERTNSPDFAAYVNFVRAMMCQRPGCPDTRACDAFDARVLALLSKGDALLLSKGDAHAKAGAKSWWACFAPIANQ